MRDIQAILEKAGLGNLLGRDASSLRKEEWAAIDDEVIDTVQPLLQARDKFAPLIDRRFTGAGWLTVKGKTVGGRAPAKIDLTGEPETGDLPVLGDTSTPVPVIHAESPIPWRMLEASRNGREGLDLTATAAAASEVAQKEETLLVRGDADLGIDGIANPTGRATAPGADWDANPENVYADLSAMDAYLNGNNAEGRRFAGPRLLIVNPAQALRLNARYTDGGGSTPYQEARDAGLVNDIFVTPEQPAGVAALVPLNRAYQRIFPMVDITTDELPSPGRNTLLSTYAIETVQTRLGAAIVERTGL